MARTTRNLSKLQGVPPKQLARGIARGIFALSVLSLWYWQWQLLVTASVGIGSMWLCYAVNHRYRRWRLDKVLRGHNGKLLLAVTIGCLGGLLTYMGTGIWLDTESHFLAVNSIVQSFTSLSVLGLLAWQLANKKSRKKSRDFNSLLPSLSAESSLKRLIAVHQLTDIARQRKLTSEKELQLTQYFQLMLFEPQEPVVREALLDGLEILERDRGSLTAEMAIPLKIKRSHLELT